MRLTCILLLTGCLAAPIAASGAPKPHTPAHAKTRAAKSKANKAKPAAREQSPAAADTGAAAGASVGQQEKPAQEPAAGQQEGAAPEKQVAPQTTSVTVGYANWGLSGNPSKFRQYATPPHDFYLQELLWAPLASPQGYQGSAVIRAPFQRDYYLEGLADVLWGTTRVEGWLQRNTFLEETPLVVPQSDQQWTNASLRQRLGMNWGFSLNARMDEANWLMEPPHFPLHQRTRYGSAIANGKFGPGELGFTASNWRYFDRTLVLPDTTYNRLEARYLWQPTYALGIEGSYGTTQIQQPGLPNSHVESLTLAGNYALGADTDIEGVLRRDNYDLPINQAASVRHQGLGGLTLYHRWRNWSAQLGARERELTRVRGDRTFVDVPKWWTVDGRVSGRINRNFRLGLRAWHEKLTDGPPMVTEDVRPLYWETRNYGQVKLEGTWPTVMGYLVGTWREYNNDARSVTVTNRNLLLGGNWEVNPRVSIFGEYSFDSWSGNSEVTAFPNLANFMPDVRLSVIGANWSLGSRATAWLSYTDWATDNDNPLLLRDANTRGRLLSMSLRYLFPSGNQLGLIFAPWVYRDKVASQMDYDTAVVMVTGTAKF